MLCENEKFQNLFIKNNKEYKNDKFDNNLPAGYYYNTKINKTFIDLHNYALSMKARSYIIGPNEKVVNNFKFFDIGTRYDLKSDLYFPYAHVILKVGYSQENRIMYCLMGITI
jgi:hypothetical protein